MRRKHTAVGIALLACFMLGFVVIPASAAASHSASPSAPAAASQPAARTVPPGLPPCNEQRDGQTVRVLGQVWQCKCNSASCPGWVQVANKSYLSLTLATGDEVVTPKATLIMQNDGNLVVYDETGRARWASNTVGRGTIANFQSDANFVVYDFNNNPVWASNTCCHSDAYLAIQFDGNVVIYGGPNGLALWSTRTAQ